jgi:ribonuclease P protein component
MKAYLRGSQDFQSVYRNGNRYDRISMTAFVLPNELSHHRLGVTASRKAIGNAVQRNRAKRVLREVFRLSEEPLLRLGKRYDWVLNAKGRLLAMKTSNVSIDFEQILESVASREAEDNGLQVA